MIDLAKKIIEKSPIIERLRHKRLRITDQLCNHQILSNKNPIKILEVGCNQGRDVVKFLNGRNDIELYGIDLYDYGLRQHNFKMIVQDADKIDFPDKFFDFVLSYGVLEHIQPIEKLCKVVSEINRVGKNYVINIPSINSIIESHTESLLWHLRDRNCKKNYHSGLNFFSDEAWLQFEGFKEAKTLRKNFMSFLLVDLYLYRTE